MRRLTDTSAAEYTGNNAYWLYNGLDCCITVELLQKLKPQLDELTGPIYNFSKALQAPALEMSLRGLRVDKNARDKMLKKLRKDEERILFIIGAYAHAQWGKPLNPNSPIQLKTFFYEELEIEPIKVMTQGRWATSVNRDALEQLQAYLHARPMALAILALRDCEKKIQVLTKEIDPDGRFRPGFSIAGTQTGRWSSASNPRRTASNVQNITKEIRHIFIADPGKKIAYVDLEQAESRAVGLYAWLCSGLDMYLNACFAGDLHTDVCSMVWKNLAWTGDKAKDKDVAEVKFYRDFSYRDLAKRAGHGSNYLISYKSMAKHLKTDQDVAQAFQTAYFGAFMDIRKWHDHVTKMLQSTGHIINAVGRRRRFFGRLNEDSTRRVAVAYGPQSLVADLLNYGMLRVWCNLPQVELLAQVHDAIVFQYPEELENTIIRQVVEQIEVELTFPDFELEVQEKQDGKFVKVLKQIKGRKFKIPCEPKIGWNWGEFDFKKPDKNPEGMKKFKGNDDRKRLALLERRL